jgi:hypothetical protein
VNKKKQKNFFILGHGCDVANAHGRESKKFLRRGRPAAFFKKRLLAIALAVYALMRNRALDCSTVSVMWTDRNN